MPEGHTIHRLAREHAGLLGGLVVAASSPQGRFAAGAALIDARPLAETDAHGKHLFHRYGEHWLHVHLGLYGRFTVGPAPAPPPVGELRLRLRTDAHWVDLRGPAVCEVIDPAAKDALHARLGVDPLRPGADPAAAAAQLARSRTPVGQLQLDQALFAGVGLVYATEVLFRAGVDPHRPGRTVPADVLDAMWRDLVALMADGVRTGRIDTVHPEHLPAAMGRPPRRDRHGGEVYAYRRAGQPCLVCGTPIAAGRLGGRNAYWCPRCQS